MSDTIARLTLYYCDGCGRFFPKHLLEKQGDEVKLIDNTRLLIPMGKHMKPHLYEPTHGTISSRQCGDLVKIVFYGDGKSRIVCQGKGRYAKVDRLHSSLMTARAQRRINLINLTRA